MDEGGVRGATCGAEPFLYVACRRSKELDDSLPWVYLLQIKRARRLIFVGVLPSVDVALHVTVS